LNPLEVLFPFAVVEEVSGGEIVEEDIGVAEIGPPTGVV
jgi:hypothetical protein